jgi:hypothetical protein
MPAQLATEFIVALQLTSVDVVTRGKTNDSAEGSKRFVTYEECRLLGYRTPIRTSQETYYVSATQPSRSMLHKI